MPLAVLQMTVSDVVIGAPSAREQYREQRTVLQMLENWIVNGAANSRKKCP